MTDDILRDCREVLAKFAQMNSPLVAFEMGTAFSEALLAAVPTTKPTSAAPSLMGVQLRVVRHLRPDVCIPVYRTRDGEETWGTPFYLPAKAETKETGR